jgi:Rrf2 family nitric oxide-sensitive transcriptional repressor
VKLTLFTDLALRLLVYLATEPGRRATIAEVASAFGVSENHLVKVAHALGRTGFLLNVRGRGGGLELAVDAALISVEDVVHAMEGEAEPAACFSEGAPPCTIGRCCRLRGVFGEALGAFYGVLSKYSIADLIRDDQEQLRSILFMKTSTTAGARP